MAFDFISGADEIKPGSPAHLDNIFNGTGTFMAWVNADALPGGGSTSRIGGKTPASTDNNGWYYTIDNLGALRFSQDFSGDIGIWGTNNGVIATGTDYHVAAVYDGSSSSNDPLLYRDGLSETVFQLAGPTGSAVSEAGNQMVFGARDDTARNLNGRLWDVRLYDRLLSASEIQTIYTARGTDSIVYGSLGRWPMFGQVGTSPSAHDVSIFQNVATNGSSTPLVQDPNAGHW